MMVKNLSDFQIQYIKGVGPKRASLLTRLGIKTVKDALYYLPYRYEDRSNIRKISDLRYGNTETVFGKVISAEVIRLPGRNLKIFELTINDGSGLLKGKWFNQPFMKKNFKVGHEVLLCGSVKRNPYRGIGFEMDNPEYEIVSDDGDPLIHTNRVVPVYRVTSGLSVRQIRSIMFNILTTCIKDVSDTIPAEIINRTALPDLSQSLSQIHFPDSYVDVELLNRGVSDFHKRLAFDELFMLELGLAVMKRGSILKKGIAFNPGGTFLKRLMEVLPFRLTRAQENVFNDIIRDMKRPYPMNRLIEGDVGCGKTIVALMAMLTAAECRYQSALMAPTEILAEQHYINIYRMIEDLGLKLCLLTGSMKDRPLNKIASGEIDMVVGTHALIQEGVVFKNLGLVVIDEQHRFGVMQRALLRRKANNPDVLVMTATPIPRTLALTLYGDLDYSVIDELPPERRPVTTLLFNSKQKDYIYRIIKEEVKKGRQVYVVYPIIEESEKTDLRSAIIGKNALEKFFPEFKVMLLHGRMKAQEREEIMASFKQGEIDILVTTTVIEVGVDVPNATLMLIIHAERFGLSQLHQLRGRIGRGSYQSYCILLAYEPYREEAKRRLDIMVKSNDGFRIAEEDLNIRGPGEFFGTRQSGMPDLRIANIIRDGMLLSKARREAFSIIDRDPDLKGFPLLRKSLETFWEGKIELFKTG
ncbi:MAG: DNA helicase RecG [Nitrospirae bacterium CG_4_10_14_0_8_um_filter_41_23]|nr:MAG: ATP-dependent DNA helicase RecG [Nitrospirae bacterium CG11_big_fil_rev_8_21_14_0_20_41_14]PIV44143.1 MAG: DNA helicase RecG [Nitrospirae bacterium CG02_land_8_20_14_3_00_41_53]PIW87270.1 MAG: DNA helicase RecG [Nitrospirae bacterium CG_4_8_14_3_um_filter_41_47]PIY86837.1 MAG: DNA helicase RecG [Nitrospirae bacterium CG_4_10_14_0_8_um_filter_41_23]PJA79400.1 MAG: DNA helicase RecG [Nitrospirae bacterium CG_4_9_14_3_um_filter_41_27]